MTADIKLLVSVRSVKEADAAINGGADIVDVKDPDRGSLGFAGWEIIGQIRRSLTAFERETDRGTILSAALGELAEWEDDQTVDPSPDLPCLDFAKIGLARVGLDSDWKQRWARVRRRFGNVKSWVAVAYSDYQHCDAPDPRDVFREAVEAGCSVLLLDTYVKNGRTTFDHLAEDDLRDLMAECHRHQLSVALAGQVSEDNLAQLQVLNPEIVAVRGAVCHNGDRRAEVQEGKVRGLRKALDRGTPK